MEDPRVVSRKEWLGEGRERLELQPIGLADAGELWRLHQDPGIARWYGGTWSRAEAQEYAAASQRALEADGVTKWLARRRADGTLIGRGGCSVKTIEGRRQLEVGWAIREEFWGRGYATEIGRAGLAFAFGPLGAARVVAFTETHNLRSRAVMDRLGMSYCHDFTHPGLWPGSEAVRDDAVFALYDITAASWAG